MGVARDFHRAGTKTALVSALSGELRRRGVLAVEVETVADSDYAPYEGTRAFYRRLGFRGREDSLSR